MASGALGTPAMVVMEMVMQEPNCKLEASMENYSVWRYLMTTVLRMFNLIHYVIPCDTDPATPVSRTVAGARRFLEEEDKLVMSMINATLTYQTLTFVVDCSSAQQVWRTLEVRRDTLAGFRVGGLIKSLDHSRLEKAPPMSHCLEQLSLIRRSLASYGHRIPDSLLVDSL